MTPTRFYCWLHEQRYLWPGLRRWQPKPDQSFPLGIVLAAPVLCALPALAVALLVRIQAGADLPVFLLGVLGLLLFSVALAHFGFVALAWNQRAAKLRAGSVTAPGRPPVWALVVLGLPYFLLISVVTPVAVLLGIENLRGAMAWREARAALVARGERLTFAELLPPPVPAEQNIASLPAFAGLFAYTQTNRGPIVWTDTNAMSRFRVLQLPDRHLPKRKDDDRTPLSLADWAHAFRASISNRAAKAPKGDPAEPVYPAAPTDVSPAQVVLTALGAADPFLRDICAAAQRPYARFPVHYNEGFNALLPHLAQGKSLSRHVALRQEAKLGVGDVEGAFAELQCGLRLATLFAEEPLLISQLVRIAQGAIVANSLWPGIRGHQWTEPQLAELQQSFARGGFMAGLTHALEGERAGAMLMMDEMAARGTLGMVNVGFIETLGSPDGDNPPAVPPMFFPGGWFRQNQARIAGFHQRMIELGRGLATNSLAGGWAQPLRDFDTEMDGRMQVTPTFHNMIYRMLVPALGRSMQKAARGEQTALMASTACALERHWRKHGSYPETLSALVPEFLPAEPRDLMDGRPLRYAKTPEGFFKLWAVGRDGVDDGGVAKKKGMAADETGIDWVWPN
jgi:hypothetical protein